MLFQLLMIVLCHCAATAIGMLLAFKLSVQRLNNAALSANHWLLRCAKIIGTCSLGAVIAVPAHAGSQYRFEFELLFLSLVQICGLLCIQDPQLCHFNSDMLRQTRHWPLSNIKRWMLIAWPPTRRYIMALSLVILSIEISLLWTWGLAILGLLTGLLVMQNHEHASRSAG